MEKTIYNFFSTWKGTLVGALVAAACLILFFFFPVKGVSQDLTRTLFFLGLIPVLYVVFVIKKSFRDFGWSFPLEKSDILWFFGTLLASFVFGYLMVRFTPFKAQYSLPEYVIGDFRWFLLYEMLFINIWFFLFEAFFRGFLLFTLAEKIGILSVLVSAVFFGFFLWADKSFSWSNAPAIMLSLTGGLLAYKTRSFIHSYLMGLLFIIGLDAYIIYSLKQLF